MNITNVNATRPYKTHYENVLINLIEEEIKGLITEGALERIFHNYSELWRWYHNLCHIITMLRALKSIDHGLSKENHTALVLMILYHDLYYKIGNSEGTNEYTSAETFGNDFSHLDFTTFHLVKRGIISTIKHQVEPDEAPEHKPTIELLNDLDLMSLGASKEDFIVDTGHIWLEHQSMLTKGIFFDKRSEWAEEFLKRKNIFATKHFTHLERQARENLQLSII